MLPEQARHVTRNVAMLMADNILFFIAFTLWEPMVVVPVFVQELTGSVLTIGLLSAVRILMTTVPQMWAASYLSARPRKQPLLVASSLMGRIPLGLLAVATLFWARSAPWLVVGVLAVAYVLFWASEGMNSISWPDLVGKVVPAGIRGRFLGGGQLLSSLGAVGAGLLVRRILGDGGPAFPHNWVLLMGLALAGMMASAGCLALARELPDERPPSRVDMRRSLSAMSQGVRADGRLRRMIGVQLLVGLAAAVYPFFVVRARDLFPSNGEMIGLFLVLQSLGSMAAAMLCGHLIDRVGSWLAILLVTSSLACSLLLVSTATLLGAPRVSYLVGFALAGFYNGGSWWSFSSYLLEIADTERRPLYLAASGMLQGLNAASAVLVGVLFEHLTPELVFAGGLLVSLGAVAVAGALAQISPRVRKAYAE